MRLDQLVKAVKWRDIKPVLKEKHPDTFKTASEGFKDVLAELKKLKPDKNAERGTLFIEHRIETYQFDDEPDEVEEWEDVFATFDNDPEQHYGLDFTPWEEWLVLTIDEQTLDAYTVPEIVAHCIWDMTFYGFTQEKIQGIMNSLLKPKKDGKWYTQEEVFGKLRDKYLE